MPPPDPATSRSIWLKLIDLYIGEWLVMSVVVLNAAAMFAHGFTDGRSQAAMVLATIDFGCIVYFLIETCLKIGRLGLESYWRSGWNRFDFLVVVLSLPALATPWLDVQHFAAILVLRLGRLFRLFRLLRFIPNRDHLVRGIKRSARASVGVVIALALINFILALGANVLFGRLAPEHFGNPAIAFYSLFRVFTLEGWYELPDLLAARADMPYIGTLARIYFMIAVLGGGLLGLSIANAVFVDEMTADNTYLVESKVDAVDDRLAAVHAELRGLREELRALAARARPPDPE